MQSVQTELRIEKAAMRSIQRATEAGTEQTVEKHLRHESDVKETRGSGGSHGSHVSHGSNPSRMAFELKHQFSELQSCTFIPFTCHFLHFIFWWGIGRAVPLVLPRFSHSAGAPGFPTAR